MTPSQRRDDTIAYLRQQQARILAHMNEYAQTASGVLRAHEAVAELEHCIEVELQAAVTQIEATQC